MNRWHPLIQLFLARLREFYREPEVLFWVYGFPLVLALGLGIAFSGGQPDAPAVDIQETSAAGSQQTTEPSEAANLQQLLQDAGLSVTRGDEESCRYRLRIGKTTLVIIPAADGYQYVYDPTRPESLQARYRIDDLVQRWKAGKAAWPSTDRLMQEPGNRYIDFLIPGLMGLNLMSGGLWGVGFVIVDMRVRKLLKRLLATPMRREDFLLSILGSRLLFVVPEMLLLVLFGWLIFGMPVRGNLLTLAVVIVAGSAAFSGIGLLAACRASKTETISGLINLVMLPMWILSGTFFSSKRFPDIVQPLIQALPLTQLNDALREVILEGASLGSIAGRVLILAGWAAITYFLALRWFRWQ
jgi:ABC transporter DrrB family efflux protein